jgi:hypothetical protein
VASALLCVIRLTALQQESTAEYLANDPSKFDERVEAASVRHDADFFVHVLADDVRFTHGTGLVQSKQQWIDSVRKNATVPVVRNLDSVEVEAHRDLVETIGHVQVKTRREQKEVEYHIWFVRLYGRRDNAWRLVSNRTVRQVNGPIVKQ